jgi:hypothetical protein
MEGDREKGKGKERDGEFEKMSVMVVRFFF